MEEAGIGLLLPFEDLSSDIFLKHINKILLDSQYQKNVEKVSEIFKSDFQPIENAVYWIEHVMKFKEEFSFKPPVSEAPLYEYLFLDFICMFYLGGHLILKFLRIVRDKCFSWCRKRKNVEKEEPKGEKTGKRIDKKTEKAGTTESNLKDEGVETEDHIKNDDLDENEVQIKDTKIEQTSKNEDEKPNESPEISLSGNNENDPSFKKRDGKGKVKNPKFKPKNTEIDLMNKAKIN